MALYDPFGVDVPLNFDITHSLTTHISVNGNDVFMFVDTVAFIGIPPPNLTSATSLRTFQLGWEVVGVALAASVCEFLTLARLLIEEPAGYESLTGSGVCGQQAQVWGERV